MNDFLVSVRNGTAPDRLSRAQFVHLAASDMTSLPDGEKLSRVGKRVDGLVSLKLLNPHVEQVECKSWSHVRYPNPDGSGRWVVSCSVAGSRRDGRDWPAGAEQVVTYRPEAWFTPEEVARCLRELGDKGSELKSQGLALWLKQHGEELDASVKENRPPAGFEGDTAIKKRGLLKLLTAGNYGGCLKDVEAKLDHAAKYDWLRRLKVRDGYFWRNATIDAFGRQGYLPGWRNSQAIEPQLRVIRTGT